jgi:hypothetical protein
VLRTSSVIHRDTSCRELRRIPFTTVGNVGPHHHTFPLPSHTLFFSRSTTIYTSRSRPPSLPPQTHTLDFLVLPAVLHTTHPIPSRNACKRKHSRAPPSRCLFPRRLMNSISPPHHRFLCVGAASPRVSMARTCSSGLARTHAPFPHVHGVPPLFLFLFVHIVQQNIRSYANHMRELLSRYFSDPQHAMETTVSFWPPTCGCAGPRGNTVLDEPRRRDRSTSHSRRRSTRCLDRRPKAPRSPTT